MPGHMRPKGGLTLAGWQGWSTSPPPLHRPYSSRSARTCQRQTQTDTDRHTDRQLVAHKLKRYPAKPFQLGDANQAGLFTQHLASARRLKGMAATSIHARHTKGSQPHTRDMSGTHKAVKHTRWAQMAVVRHRWP